MSGYLWSPRVASQIPRCQDDADVGLAIIGAMNNGLTLMGVPAYWQLVVKGRILLAAVVYDELRHATQEDT